MIARRGKGSTSFVQTIFRDVVSNLLLGVLVMLVLALLYTAQKEAQSSETKKADPVGDLIVHITWDPGDIDVDLWVDGPGEKVPVGYSNKGGKLWNLLRDDLGDVPDATPLNYEDAATRGIVQGEYTINVHCFRCNEYNPHDGVSVNHLPVTVQVEVDEFKPGHQTMDHIATSTIVLRSECEERTALRFELNDQGGIVDGSLSSVFKPLRDLAPPGATGKRCAQ